MSAEEHNQLYGAQFTINVIDHIRAEVAAGREVTQWSVGNRWTWQE